jgi:predicted enzyme related to lactoylglutathione lyase
MQTGDAGLLVNVDVDDLEGARGFYCHVFGLSVGRRLGDRVLELVGLAVPIYLLLKEAGTPASSQSQATRTYERHWTPVHLDFVVDDVDAVVRRAVAAGAALEDAIQTRVWGRIAHLSDPFGHGICVLQFLNRGYDEIASSSPGL